MESKHLTIRMESYTIATLLIEPVWNRNCPVSDTAQAYMRPFNRTSMESKRGMGINKNSLIGNF